METHRRSSFSQMKTALIFPGSLGKTTEDALVRAYQSSTILSCTTSSGDQLGLLYGDERVQGRGASLRAFSESHSLPQLDFGHVSTSSALPIAHRALRTADGVEPTPLASTSHPTVSIPLTWAELEDGPLHQTSLTPQVLIGRLGDRFAPVLQADQRLSSCSA